MHEFRVWAPLAKKIAVKIGEKSYQMEGPAPTGRWRVKVEEAGPGTEYTFLIDDDPTPYPDPRSLSQPRGVHGPSMLYDQRAYKWQDQSWHCPPLGSAVIYEMHIGTFTQAGTFDAAIERLSYLHDLGVTHLEVMPVAEWAGERGWGYDGVCLYATHEAYGGPDAFKRFVDAAHTQGLAIILDVVYNHFGPVGNYTGKFGPYNTEMHHTPWGAAVNFEREGSDEVRRFFIDNALMWMRDFHVDGLRLDAIHEIFDRSAIHFLEQLAADVENLSTTFGRRLSLIGESDLNDPRVIRPIEANGYGLDAQWSDDFHHALATILFTDPDHKGYYDDFGAFASLAKAAKEVFVYDGNYSKFRERSHGRPVDSLSAHHFVNFLQNHDQIGNRAFGDRIQDSVGLARTKAAIGLVLTAPMIPMLFMGEEYAASTPFLYFADHDDPEMAKLVAEGRKREFADFGFDEAEIPNPEDPSTFTKSKLNWEEVTQGVHAEMHDYVRALIKIRRSSSSLNDGDRGHLKVSFNEEKRWLRMDRRQVTTLINLGPNPVQCKPLEDQRLLLTSTPGATFSPTCLTLPSNGFAILSAEEE